MQPEQPQDNVELDAIAQNGLKTNESLDDVNANTAAAAVKLSEIEQNTEAQIVQSQKNTDTIKKPLDQIVENTKPKEVQRVRLEGREEDESDEDFNENQAGKALWSMLRGPKGAKGDSIKGDKGDTGADSKVIGPVGPAGKKGDKGEKGEKGDKGNDSIVPGPRGKDGLKGDAGDKGDKGADADSKKIVKETEAIVREKIGEEVDKRLDTNMQSIERRISASKSYSTGDLTDTQEATPGQAMIKQADGTWYPGTAGGGAVEGTAILSTGETVGKVLQADGDGTSSFVALAGGGNAQTANPLSQFAATTLAQLNGVISDATLGDASDFATVAQGALADSAQQPPSEGAFVNGDKTKLDTYSEANQTDNNAKVTNATHTGEVTGSTALTIANNAVITARIADNAVTNAKIAGAGTRDATTFYRGDGTFATPAGGGSIAIGDTITSATLGSVLFAGASGVLAQDNTNFFWDDTNNRLGIGTAAPGTFAKLGVEGSSANRVSIEVKNTNAFGNASFYFQNNRGSFATYGGLLTGGSSDVGGNLLGLTRSDKTFLIADGASSLGLAIGTLTATPLTFGTNNATVMTLLSGGNVGIGLISPTAALHLKAGTAAASTAPLKLTSGTLNTTPEAGAVEFLTDAYYGTITTGAARRTFAFLESPTFTGTVVLPANTVTNGMIAGAGARNATTFYRGDGTFAAPSSGFADPLTTNGDIIARIAASTTRLAQGANGTFLGVSGGTLGYYTPAGSGGTVDTVVSGTGITIDATDAANPIANLSAESIASLALADTSSQATGVENNADVTDTANVTAAGALMDSEVTNLAQVKAFDSTDYAAALGADDNYVTDAEKTVIGNTSGTNSGDQDLSGKANLASPTFTGTVGLPNNTVTNAMIAGTGTRNSTTFYRGDGTFAEPAGGGADIQTFTSSGTWTKPATGSRVLVQAWGGGGGGAKNAADGGGGGGGGSYKEAWFNMADLGATETITIGAGGLAASGFADGGDGGETTFGSKLTAFSGAGGQANFGGGGGGFLSSSSISDGGSPLGGTSPGGDSTFGGAGGGRNSSGQTLGGSSIYGGGGGGSGGGFSGNGGNSIFGGGGGGGGAFSGTRLGGSSTSGGAGGNGAPGRFANATAGQQPGGGGGGADEGNAAAGGAGKVIITVI